MPSLLSSKRSVVLFYLWSWASVSPSPLSTHAILQNTIYPLIVILYAMPKSAFAPLMVIWVGYGLFSKIAIAFLVAFFPIVVNTVVGLKEIEPELLDLARINRASEFDVFKKIRLAQFDAVSCSPGSKSRSCLSVTGAIVAEFVAANEGLGYLVLQANYNLDTAFALVILLILAVLSLGLFWLAELFRRKLRPGARRCARSRALFSCVDAEDDHAICRTKHSSHLVGAIVFALALHGL